MEKLVQNWGNFVQETSKSVNLNTKKWNKAKFSLNKDSTVQFEPRQNAYIFKKLYSKGPTSLVKKLPIRFNKFKSVTTKNYYAGRFNNQETNFIYSICPKILKNLVLLKYD